MTEPKKQKNKKKIGHGTAYIIYIAIRNKRTDRTATLLWKKKDLGE